MKTLPFFLGVCFLFSIYFSLNHALMPKPIESEKLKKIASDFGLDFFGFANIISKHDEVQKRFQSSVGSDVKKIELKELVEDMVNETNTSFKEKIEAIRKVMSTAEEAALEHFQKYDNPVGPDGKPEKRKLWPDCYRNARKVNKQKFVSKQVEGDEEEKKEEKCDLTTQTMELKKDSHFDAKSGVNTTFSIIHTPTSIYDQRADVLEGIAWTKPLDQSYISNYQNNPTMYWQYFCSYKGFFRQYPAIKWAIDNSEKHNPDLYDCRMRPWYIAAANTPKNVIILHDVSGSMTGLRREIAKHVVFTVLETLTDNDYVNVFNFTDETTPVVACFKDGLVQANLENIREFKVALDQDRTAGVANFTAAFNTAFGILEKARGGKPCESSNCNEAIFLITDGVPYKYEEIFDEHNKDPNKLEPGDPGYNDPKIQTRVFTYLIGREVTQKGEVMWIACNNKGYYVHITTLGEVQEQVLRYMHVMSKPMVLENEHNVSWTPVYADVAEIIESDWLWDDKNAKRQKERSERYKSFRDKLFNQTDGDKFYVVTDGEGGSSGKGETKRIAGKRVAEFLDYGITNPDEEQLRMKFALEERIERSKLHRWGPDRKFKFMVSVSLPVFDLRNTSVRRTKAKADKEEKIAIFLGVVGTDIPITELQKIASPFKLGVNGYAFAITENGYIVFHPDWRPLLIDILKPNYNTVDLTEVEIVNNDTELRNQDEDLKRLRKSMIDMEVGPSRSHALEVRIHQDNFKRVTIRKQQYAYAKINQTQYTLGIAIPTSNQYKFVGEIELRRDGQGKDFTHYFEGVSDSRKWRINPDWTYCEFIRGEHPELQSKEDLLIHFLRDIQNASVSWAWRNTGVGVVKRTHKDNLEDDIYSCQKDLVQSLVFDANVTEVFTSSKEWRFNDTQSQLAQRYGAVIAFIATRSGLTRWINITADDLSSSTDIPFIEDNAHATEEIWYKRAVERYNIETQSYVISVPHDAGTRNDSPPLVTAARAVFVTGKDFSLKDKNKKNGKNLYHAPVAVTGVQFNYENLSQRFVNFAKNACLPDEHNCYLLDDNAFIIYSSVKTSDLGRFFGEVNGAAMDKLWDLKVYKRVRVVDYQAICYHLVAKAGFANILLTPFNHLKFLFQWFVAKLAWLALQINVHSLFYPDFSSVLANAITAISDDQELEISKEENPNTFPYLELASINKTRLRPCHQEYFLYTYGPDYIKDVKEVINKDHTKDQKPAPKSIFYKSANLPSCGSYGYIEVVNIPKTNLIMVVTDARCDRGKIKTNIKASEVQYELDEEVVNITQNEVLTQTCRTPYLPLYRKRPKSCFAYHEEESSLREDCGSKATIIETSIPSLLILWITALMF